MPVLVVRREFVFRNVNIVPASWFIVEFFGGGVYITTFRDPSEAKFPPPSPAKMTSGGSVKVDM